MDSINPAIIDWIIRAAILGCVAFLGYRPAMWAIEKLRGIKPAATETDNRAELNTALCLLADRVQQTKCEKLKAEGDKAVTTLSTIIIRDADYVPPV